MSEIKTQMPAPTYNYGDVLTPFAEQGQSWDTPIGSWRAKARFWRVLTVWFTAAALFFFIIFIAQARLPGHRIVVTEINPQGEVSHIGMMHAFPATGKTRQQVLEAGYGKQ